MNVIFKDKDDDELCKFETPVFPLKVGEIIMLLVANPSPAKWPDVNPIHGHYKVVGIDHSWEKIYPHSENGTIKQDLTTFVIVEKSAPPDR